MKHYKITVNGQTYEVGVEELAGSAAAISGAAPVGAALTSAVPAAQLQAVPAQTAAAISGAAPAAPASAVPAAGAAHVAGATTVKAPMPGTVMSFKVIAGQSVKRGDVLLILEAMKMENEIVAPQDGTVAALRVAVSSSVNTGDDLVDLA